MSDQIPPEMRDRIVNEFEKYKSLLSVPHFLFKGEAFRVYGTNDEPLFLVNDIVCGILGKARPTDNKFFRKNRDNDNFVNLCPKDTAPIDLQERFKNSNYDYIYMFTVKGLYMCLLHSHGEISELLQSEIIDLLENIRKGFIQLVIQDKVRSDMEKEDIIKRATKTCSLYIERVYDDNGEIEGEYGGITHRDPEIRDREHRSRSCNRHLREALTNGKRVVMEVVGTFEYIDEVERKRKERELIESIAP